MFFFLLSFDSPPQKKLQEFENENTIVDQTNAGSRSEFPIFRAISPTPNTCHSLNNTENNLDNRILSNIVNQNQVNINSIAVKYQIQKIYKYSSFTVVVFVFFSFLYRWIVILNSKIVKIIMVQFQPSIWKIFKIIMPSIIYQIVMKSTLPLNRRRIQLIEIY